MEKTAKYFINLEKAYKEGNKIVVQGIASGTLEDRDEERVNVKVLEKFAQKINSEGLELINGHQHGGAIDDDLGMLTYAEVVKAEHGYDLFVKGELEPENPVNQLILKRLEKGKQLAFSLTASAITKMVFSERLGKMIREFVDAVPINVSITTKPSYIPSFLEVLQKSCKSTNATSLSDNSSYISKNMKETKEVETTQEVAETTEETKTETTQEVVETKPEEKVEDAEVVEETEEVSETTEDTEEASEVDKSYDKRKEGVSVEDRLVSMEKSISERFEGVEKNLSEEMKKAFEEMHNVLKSFHEDIETLKDMPLQKKSKAQVVEKSYEEAKAPTLRDQLAKVI
jgi:hypothetical protein